MLRWLGEPVAADVLFEAVENVCFKGITTADLGGSSKTVEVTSAVCAEIEKMTKIKSTL